MTNGEKEKLFLLLGEIKSSIKSIGRRLDLQEEHCRDDMAGVYKRINAVEKSVSAAVQAQNDCPIKDLEDDLDELKKLGVYSIVKRGAIAGGTGGAIAAGVIEVIKLFAGG